MNKLTPVSAAAKYFGQSPKTIYLWIRRGAPAKKVFGDIFIDLAGTEAWLKENPQFGGGPGRKKVKEDGDAS